MIDGPVRWTDPVPQRGPGVYVIETVAPSPEAPLDHAAIREWLDRARELRLDGARPEATDLARRLASFWIPDTPVLFIGAAPRSIAGRIAAQLSTPLGVRRPYAGAHWLRTLREEPRWRVWWARTDAVEEYTDALLSAFAEAAAPLAGALPDGSPVLPFGNLETVTGERRPHGITGALVDADADPEMAARDASAKRRAKATAARAPRASRAPATPSSRRRTVTSAPGHAGERTHVSADGLARLEAELEELRTVQRPEVIRRVAAARALGDLRENADYEAARNEQSFLEGRIRSVEALIGSAVVIEATGSPEVRLGSRVLVEVDGEQRTFELVGSTEADPQSGRISDRSPVGKALLGGRAGDDVPVRLPAGEVRYRIVEVG